MKKKSAATRCINHILPVSIYLDFKGSFFKNLNVSFLYPYFLTLLGAPITLFEMFPFIFLLSTQFLFYDLFKKEELNILKSNGLSNFRIIKILFLNWKL